jgi:hypothetical protein
MQRHLLDPNVVEALTVTDDAVTEVVIIDHDGEHRAFSTDEHYAGPFKSRAETISRDYGEQVAVFFPLHQTGIVRRPPCGAVSARVKRSSPACFLSVFDAAASHHCITSKNRRIDHEEVFAPEI